ncbi:MAG: zf-TFIIB domain-containing protein [Thermomicrobiales bacterium]
MLCPIDQTVLVISERQGIEIDYCPQCRGVWLDRGELDKLVDRATEQVANTAAPQVAQQQRGEHQDSGFGKVREAFANRDNDRRDYDRDDDDYTIDKNGRRKKKKDSFLGDLFDF